MTRTAAAMISVDEHKLSKLKSLAGGEGFLSRSIYSNFNLLKRLISFCNGDDTDVSFRVNLSCHPNGNLSTAAKTKVAGGLACQCAFNRRLCE